MFSLEKHKKVKHKMNRDDTMTDEKRFFSRLGYITCTYTYIYSNDRSLMFMKFKTYRPV